MSDWRPHPAISQGGGLTWNEAFDRAFRYARYFVWKTSVRKTEDGWEWLADPMH